MGCHGATGILGDAAIERTSCPTQSPAAAPAPLAPALEDAHVQNDGELPFPCGVTHRKHQPWKRPPSLGFLDTGTMLRLQSPFRPRRSPEAPTSVRGCSAMPQNRENPSPAQLGTEAGGAQEISIHHRLVTSQTGAKPTIFFQLPSKLEFLETCGWWGKRSARGGCRRMPALPPAPRCPGSLVVPVLFACSYRLGVRGMKDFGVPTSASASWGGGRVGSCDFWREV